ncbi:MAG: hypothetical protein FWE30_02075 [Bacteroidales bacterium]|nr:hypothetical protein [Bacteroidales bacterium]
MFAQLCSFVLLQTILPFNYLTPQSIEQIEIKNERTFEGPGLYGFINGGADLFLEYGFQQLLEQRFAYQGISFIAEYYLMDTQEHAYGIYSIHAFKCLRADERFPVECLTPGLLQFYHDRLYVTLKCLDRTIDALPYLDRLAAEIIAQNPYIDNTQMAGRSLFPASHSGNLYYVCGDLGLSTAYITWAEHFVPFQNYAMWLWIDPETKQPAAQVRFASAEDAKAFYVANEKHFNISVEQDTTTAVLLPKVPREGRAESPNGGT